MISSQRFPSIEMFESKDFVCFLAMPLFLSRALLTVPTLTSHLSSDTASVEQAALSSLYVFLSCIALHGSCAKTGLDWSCETK